MCFEILSKTAYKYLFRSIYVCSLVLFLFLMLYGAMMIMVPRTVMVVAMVTFVSRPWCAAVPFLFCARHIYTFAKKKKPFALRIPPVPPIPWRHHPHPIRHLQNSHIHPRHALYIYLHLRTYISEWKAAAIRRDANLRRRKRKKKKTKWKRCCASDELDGASTHKKAT